MSNLRQILILPILSTALLAEPQPAAAIECHARPGDGSYWAWRQVDGRRCYYKGRRGIDKRLLSWAKAPTEAPPEPLSKGPPARASVAPPPEPPAATLPAPPAPPPVPRQPRITEVPVRIVGAEPPPYVAAPPMVPPQPLPLPPLPQPRPAEADASDGWLLTIAVLILVIVGSAGLFATGLLHLKRGGPTYAS